MTAKRRRKLLVEKEGFKDAIKDIVRNKNVKLMKTFNHHSDTTCFTHCVHVAYYNYKICKLLGLDAISGARAGMLHDLFLYDWHTHAKETGNRFHGLTHPRVAYLNARKDFKLNDKEKDIIIKHMWPITIALPKYKETSIICLTDKFCGLCEVIDKYARKVI